MSFETATASQPRRQSVAASIAPLMRRQDVQQAATWLLLGIACALFTIVLGELAQPLVRLFGWGGLSGIVTIGVMTVYPWLSGDLYLSRVYRPALALAFVAVPTAASLIYAPAGGLVGGFVGRAILTILTVVMPLDWAYMAALSGMSLALAALVVLAQLPVVRLMAWCIAMWQAWVHEAQTEPSVTSTRKKQAAPSATAVPPAPKQTALTAVLETYGIAGAVERNTLQGHVVDRHIIQLPVGTKTAALPLADIARDMQVKAVSIDSNVGGGCIGLDVPAKKRRPVVLADLLKSPAWQNRKGVLPVCPALDVAGEPVVFDLADLPHMIIAGTTGAGKSVFVNAMLLSLMDSGVDFRLMVADGKGEDFAPYYSGSGLLLSCETDTDAIQQQVLWLTTEMDRRFSEKDKPYPIVFVVDELADIIMQDGKDKAITKAIARLAQKARSAGITMLLATQYPIAKVIDPIIAANVPSRAGLMVDKSHQSNVVIGEAGCENLLGKGDCLLKLAGRGITRVHGAMITETEINQYMRC